MIKNKTIDNKLNLQDIIKVISLAFVVAIFYIDFRGIFNDEISSDIILRFSDFRQYSYHYYMNSSETTNIIFSDLLINNPGLLPRSIALIAKFFNNFSIPYFIFLISIIVINILSLPYFIYSLTRKKYQFILFICLMPFFTLPMAADGPMSYGYSIMPIAGNTGKSLLILLIGTIILNEKLIKKIFIGFLLFFIHPLIIAVSLPIIFIIEFFLNSDFNNNIIINQRIKIICTLFIGLLWPILLSLFLSIYKNPEKDYSKIVEWMSQHNFFIGYPFYIVIFGFLAMVYSLKLVADFIKKSYPKISFIGYVFGSYSLGLFLFNLFFVETHLINISSIIMPLRFESIVTLVYLSILIFILTHQNSSLNKSSLFILSFTLCLSFLFSSNIYGQRGIFLYLSPIVLILTLYFSDKSFKSKKKELFLFLVFFIIFCILCPSTKVINGNFQLITLLKDYAINLYPKIKKLFIFYSLVMITLSIGLVFSAKKSRSLISKYKSIEVFNKLILIIPLFSLTLPSFIPLFNKYFIQKINFQKQSTSDEEKLIKFIETNLKSNDAILKHPSLPFFRRRLTQYISTDFDLISLLPYLPRKINRSVCTLEGDYRVNIEKIIKTGTKAWWVSKDSFISQVNWTDIKNYHIKNKKVESISNFCTKKNYSYKSYNYILEPNSEKINNLQDTIYFNEKYRLSKIKINDDNLNKSRN